MEKEYLIHITTQDFRKATSISDEDECPLYHAIMRQLKNTLIMGDIKIIRVGWSGVLMRGVFNNPNYIQYLITGWTEDMSISTPRTQKIQEIQALMDGARMGEVPQQNVKLTLTDESK